MLPGDRVASRFQILGEAGRGGMGTVFRARDWVGKREVALKMLEARNLESVERFEREAEILAAVKHPNIVEYISHGVTGEGAFFLVMEWVEGETLAARLDRVGLDASETVVMAIQIARALGALHAAGVVHRDVKPANLMLADRDVNRVKLVDFGIARRAIEGHRLTSTGALVGTAGYMAPEQARGDNARVSPQSDLFALGCVLHECLTGDAPFRGDSLLAARAKVLVETAPNIREVNPALPEALDALVASLLARKQHERPVDAARVERALAALTGLPTGRPVRRARKQPAASMPTDVAGTPTDATREIQLCAVLVALGETPLAEAVLAGLAGTGEVERLEGGLVVTLAGPPSMAGRIALDLAMSLPDAVVAVIASDSIDDAIDRGARLIEDVQIAAGTTDMPAGGAWTDAASAPAIERELHLLPMGTRLRLLGVAR
jgi:eukaryotic-like serine/threonine-protein kinase